MRRITVFASGRADLSPLSGVVSSLAASGQAEVTLVTCGTGTADPYTPSGQGAADVDVLDVDLGGDDDPHRFVLATAEIASALSERFARARPNLLVVLGDRFELLGVMTAAVLHQIPVAHLSGGEITEGAIDDSIRHAVTKLAHLHFAATDAAGARIVALGEEPWRVHVTGDPAIDRLLAEAGAGAANRGPLGDAALSHPLGLVTYHPPTLQPQLVERELEAIIAGSAVLSSVLVTHPGPDLGAGAIVDRLSRWADEDDRVLLVPSLGAAYPAVLAQADVMVGNSSSGIVEAPTFGVPVVNVGDRQRGRLRWPGVIDVDGDAVAVREAVVKALNPQFRSAVAARPNPYGDGRAAPRIAEILLSAPLDRLLAKRFCD